MNHLLKKYVIMQVSWRIFVYFQLCLLSDLLLEMSHFEWILGVLLEFYQNNPIEDDITAEYIVPTICKALAVLKVVGIRF